MILDDFGGSFVDATLSIFLLNEYVTMSVRLIMLRKRRIVTKVNVIIPHPLDDASSPFITTWIVYALLGFPHSYLQ